MGRTEIEQRYNFQAIFLTDNPIIIVASLKMSVEAAVGALKAFKLIFPERFTIAGLDEHIGKLVADLMTVFRPYVPKPGRLGQ
jgi:hypothetical protein